MGVLLRKLVDVLEATGIHRLQQNPFVVMDGDGGIVAG